MVASGLGVATTAVMGGAMQQVWGLINGLQVFVHLPTLGVLFPEPAQELVDYIVGIANFDLIPNLDNYYGELFEKPDEDEDNMISKFVDTGYESRYFIINAGSLFVFFLLLLVLIALLPACLLCTRLCTCCKKPFAKFKKWLFINPLIRFLLEATLDFGFSIFIQRT